MPLNPEISSFFPLTRRRFLAAGGAAASLGLIGLLPGAEPLLLSQSVLALDFTDELPVFNELTLERFLGEKYHHPLEIIARYREKMLRSDFISLLFRDYPELATLYCIREDYERHGNDVAESMRRVWKKLGQNQVPQILSLQKMLESDDVSFNNDDLGNLQLNLRLLAKRLIPNLQAHLKPHPQLKVINLSSQLGTGSISILTQKYGDTPVNVLETSIKGNNYKSRRQSYEEERTKLKLKEVVPAKLGETTRHEAYSWDRVEENILEVFDLCRAFPEKMFVCAAGNTDSDLTVVRSVYANQWPNNLIFVGVWDSEINRPSGDVWGADIYIPTDFLDDHGVRISSSYATPVISAFASYMMEHKCKSGSIRETLYQHSRKQNYLITDPVWSRLNEGYILDTYHLISYLRNYDIYTPQINR